MAVSKSTRSVHSDTRRRIDALINKSQVSQDRHQVWRKATVHLKDEPDVLRFPLYESLYRLNFYTGRLVDLIAQIGTQLNEEPDDLRLHLFTLQFIRSTLTSDIIDQMGSVEHLEAWIFESLVREEEDDLADPEDAYLAVQRLEEQRIKAGEPPRVRFLDDEPETSE